MQMDWKNAAMTTEACIDDQSAHERLLKTRLDQIGASAGTYHRVNTKSCQLELVTSVGLPTSLSEPMHYIPANKGLAGQAWSERTVVSSCDLTVDERVGAKVRFLDFKSSYAIPVFRDESVIGVMGIAFKEPYLLQSHMVEALQHFVLTAFEAKTR